jgi:hypothetical protein
MLSTKAKNSLSVLGMTLIPLCVQADQTTNTEQKPLPYTPGESIKEGQLPGAYNQSASYVCNNGWDISLTADYIYWAWALDSSANAGLGNSILSNSTTIKPTRLDPGYSSGFQVGLGFNMKGMDDWKFFGEYTWYRNNGNKSSSNTISTIDPLVSISANASGKVSFKYDTADFLVQRPYYFGKNLTANFSTGLKALWMTRTNNAYLIDPTTFTILSPSLLEGTLTTATLYDKLSSWGLGPKFGFEANWLVGYGLKFLSNVSISIPYTRYTQTVTTVTSGEMDVLALDTSLASNITLKSNGYGTIRPVLESYLGLGYGAFFCDDAFHVDLNVGYDFNVYWNYMTVLNNIVSPSSMYLHGLNIKLRFDF